MDFSQALIQLKAGEIVTRTGWNGEGMWVKLDRAGGEMDLPFLYMRTVHGFFVPWTASHTDILADDWKMLTAGGKPV